MLAASLLLLTVPFAAPDQSVVVVDIGRAEPAAVDTLKQTEGWWLELGDRLVLVTPNNAAIAEDAAAPLLSQRQGIDPERLWLRARGCSEHGPELGALISRGGRWELRLLAEGEAGPAGLIDDQHGGWRAVQPDTVIARQYRLDAGVAAAADPQIQQVVDAITPTRWFADVQTLAAWDRSSYATTSLSAARDWIGTQFSGLGLSTSYPNFTMPGSGGAGTITRQNVLGVWTGSRLPDEWIVVGGHYDSRNNSGSSTSPTPGAEDNATGCAGVIELARAVLPHNPERSILFMCYAGEEQGLRGSAAHVQALNASGDIGRISAAIIMDMIGYSADANLQVLFESYATHSAYLNQFAAAAATYVPALDVQISTNPFGSDHMPYLNAGVRGLLAIEADWALYPHYHRSTDTPANIGPNAQAMGGAILKTNAAMLATLAGLPATGFGDGFEDAMAAPGRGGAR